MIYFVQETGLFRNRIKIGFTDKIKGHMSGLRGGSPIEVEAMGAICNLQDELFEAREVIRGLLTDLSPYTREKAVKFLKQHKQSDSQEE